MTELKPDWPEARQRLRDWWEGRKTDRVVALITAPRRGAKPWDRLCQVPQMYTDPDTVFRNLDLELSSTFYGGEAIPAHWVYLGPVPLGACLGCDLQFAPDTVWQSPRYRSWEGLDGLRFDPANRWYRLLVDLTRASVRRAEGRYLVSGQGFGAAADVAANMWGSESTLVAMAERPETVKAAMQKLVDISKELYDQIDAITAPHQEGAFDWIRLWAPDRIWSLQSDLCCTISPAMFAEYIVDEIRQEAEHVPYSLYHLDGPGAVRHLGALLGIRALDGIQWVPGAGASQDPLDWIDLFRRVQEAGKKLLIYCPPDRVRALLDRIARQGVCLGVGCADQESAEGVLRVLEQIGG
jgi:hypothetical protein